MKDCPDCQALEAQSDWIQDQADIYQRRLDELGAVVKRAHAQLERASSSEDYVTAWNGWQAARRLLAPIAKEQR